MGVVAHNIPSAGYILAKDYNKVLGKDWAKAFSDFLDTEYMTNLMYFIDQIYKRQKSETTEIILPRNERDVFNPFLKTDYNDVRVVILTEEPISYSTNGLGYGNYHSLSEPNKCRQQQKMITNLKKNCINDENTIFDKTLEHWSEQGVFQLNAGMISAIGSDYKYYDHFKEFVRQTIMTICEQRMDVIFCFMTDKLKDDFAECLDADQYSLTYKEWDEHTNIFDDVNDLLEHTKQTPISW